MWGILKKPRLRWVAVTSSLALLITSTIPCNCAASDQHSGSAGPVKNHHSESTDTHPCGSHSQSNNDSSGHTEGKNSPDGSDSSCCCSVSSPSALFDSDFLLVAKTELVPQPNLSVDTQLGFKDRFIDALGIMVLPRGSPPGSSPFIISSSSTLSVRLQRWLI